PGPPATSLGWLSRPLRSANSPVASKCWRRSSSSGPRGALRAHQSPGQALQPADPVGAPAPDHGGRGSRRRCRGPAPAELGAPPAPEPARLPRVERGPDVGDVLPRARPAGAGAALLAAGGGSRGVGRLHDRPGRPGAGRTPLGAGPPDGLPAGGGGRRLDTVLCRVAPGRGSAGARPALLRHAAAHPAGGPAGRLNRGTGGRLPAP